jgi:hypothetical protein
LMKGLSGRKGEGRWDEPFREGLVTHVRGCGG